MLRLIAAFLILFCLVSCGDSGSDKDSGNLTDDNNNSSSEENCDNIPKSQGLSEPCCMKYGIDACGAGLFCEKFDGRTLATCYPEKSRGDMTECREDKHCLSGVCNKELSKCKSLPGMECEKAIGCIALDEPYLCEYYSKKCESITGYAGDVCRSDDDCDSGECSETLLLCKAEMLENCNWNGIESNEHCIAGLQCMLENGGNSICLPIKFN